MSTLALWIPLLPLLSAAALAAVSLSGRARATVPALAVLPIAAAAVLTLVVLFGHGTSAATESRIRYAATGGPELWLGARVDGLAALIAVLVGVVATAVQLYSVSYMAHEERYTSYSALISLFTAAMLVVVYSTDLLVLLVGWEVMGACSYFLIGHHWDRPEARSASIKAFLVTKLGDAPFLLGILFLAHGAGTFRVQPILQHAIAQGGHGYTAAGAILLIGGVMGKSAQIPLQTWLPDAMAGPTPISALIHAATMVAAGVYVVARLYPVFLVTPAALWILAIAAALTAVTAALSAFAQRDLKRILAYSTVSQLALMVAALAAGGRDAAVFHLMSHGGFKALLFLGAGVIIHKAGTGDVDELNTQALHRKLPVTFITMTIGLAALAGVPPFSGFFSKESIAGVAFDTATHTGPTKSLLGITPPAGIGWLVFVATLLTGFLTAAYALRTWLMLFGPLERGRFRSAVEMSQRQPQTAPQTPAPSSEPETETPTAAEVAAASEWALEALVAESIREEAATTATTATAETTGATAAAEKVAPKAKTGPEAPRAELLPLVVLAAITTVFGFVGLNRGWFPSWLGDADGNAYCASAASAGKLIQPADAYHLAPALLSTILALVALALGLGVVFAAARAKPGTDPNHVLGFLRKPAFLGFRADDLQDAVAVRPVQAAADAVAFLDTEVVDAYVRGSGHAARLLGEGLRRVQTGNVQLYLTGVLTGVVVIAAVLGFGR
ncbi:proton-translocating NADH-quinone oxidoreductase, chain L [Catenulispora acidiphila DSM 44928]|uniref:Proton-translocating NADH-quinone oxidoreductase, chain L n=1 Tax=Catenulispora acidiphila (strain DSM 44928 / JCM 14897 / NBRC 102108 / NRRL B-24433 / ID139908) TaxID=479433 RepID=C7Q2E3_CATAD|nr:NADH-quinone oxidoreductase subunit L [Catenulispora acidiphila]ACU69785.1 proton-translocating NADH-quinone oxidoreductase, chain L [Catenulispora acidiphila DSM 44928]